MDFLVVISFSSANNQIKEAFQFLSFEAFLKSSRLLSSVDIPFVFIFFSIPSSLISIHVYKTPRAFCHSLQGTADPKNDGIIFNSIRLKILSLKH